MARVSLSSASVAAAALLAGPLVFSAAPAVRAQASGQQPSAEQQGAQATAKQPGKELVVLPAATLIDRQLRDPQGRAAGQINQLVLDTENGAVDFVVVGGSGNFNLNGQDIAVPWRALKPPTAAKGPITINVSAEKLEKAPRLSPRALYELNQPHTQAGIYGYYGYPYRPRNGRYGYGAGGYGYNPTPAGVAGTGRGAYYGAPGAPGYGAPAATTVPNASQPTRNEQAQNGTTPLTQNSGPMRNGAQAQNGAAGGQQENQAQHQMVQAGLVVGSKGVVSALQSPTTTSANALQPAGVFAGNGNTIGRVDQVMIDVERGEVAFVLLQRGGFLGLNPSWYAVPIEALAWAPYQGAYRLTVDEQLLNSEPSVPVNEKNLPTHVDTQELAQLYHHFGIAPYWENGGQQMGAAKGRNAGSGSSQPPSGSH